MTDVVSSLFVGISQIVIGHPFDTIKVLIQNKKKWKGLPIKKYYKGWRYPLTESLIFNMTVFPINERVYKYTNSYFASGLISGTCVFPSAYLFNFYKINKQVKCEPKLQNLLGFKGGVPLLCREMLAMSVYFGSYHKAKENGINTLLSGGIAGGINWTLTYPLDVLMSRQIAQQISIKQAFNQKNLWKGYPVCLTRAILVNSVNFYVYEKAKNILKKF
tara:strand:+ start:17431 stop:18084 length:654 start_codon:yes stop_codon:yes gene_type:complete